MNQTSLVRGQLVSIYINFVLHLSDQIFTVEFLTFFTDHVLIGRVYRGILSNYQEVAIKHIIHEECIETFLKEVRSLTNVRHPNLVALLGYSKNAKECFLIYEICPNSNLSQWLFGMYNSLCLKCQLSRLFMPYLDYST